MKKIALVFAAAISLAACGVNTAPPSIPTAPVEVCDRTGMDEKVGIAVELAYKAWRTALELGVDTGVVKGDLAMRLAALDRTAYGFTVATQNAYQACNAADYITAARNANAAITAAIAALRNR